MGIKSVPFVTGGPKNYIFKLQSLGKKNAQIEEQTTQRPKEKGQMDKERSKKHYTENQRLSNTNLTGGKIGAPEG